MTKTFALVALALGIAGAPALAYADDACMTQATDKKLAGAAKTSFMTKCERTSCEGQAKDKKPARRRNDLFRQEMHQGRDGDVSLGPPRAADLAGWVEGLPPAPIPSCSYSLTAPVRLDT